MNVGLFALAVFVIQPLIVGLGLLGYWLRPRHPRAGLVFGLAAVVLAFAGMFVGLWQYLAAAIAGAIVGVAAVVRPRSPGLARWLAIGGTVAWIVMIGLLLLDAAG